MKLAKYGKREWLGGGVISLVLVALSVLISVYAEPFVGATAAVVFILAWFSIAAFFRDPERKIPDNDNILLSPADGVVKDIEIISGADENKYFDGKNAIRVGIFLSVFDVHINRAPCSLEVREKYYRQGKFHDARDAQASSENEAMTIVCAAKAGNDAFTVIVRQISGAIAKRIVCEVDKGSSLLRGERYGMIKFGSRTELFFPASSEFRLNAKIGDRVSAGTSVIAEIISPDKEIS